MREKILSELVKKFPGLDKKYLGFWADKLHPKVTEESQIEGVINELDNLPIPIPELAAQIQKVGDDRVTEAKKQWLKTPPKPDKPEGKTDDPPSDPPPAAPDQMPAWFKPFADKLEQMEGEKQTVSTKQWLAERLKNIPADFYDEWKLPETEEEREAFAEKVEVKFAKVVPAEAPAQQRGHQPQRSSAVPDKGPTKEQIAAVVKKLK